MKIDMKKFLLAGSALVAVSALVPAKAHAQHTLTGAGTWASAATQTSADDGTAANAATDDTVDVDTNVLTITNDGTADDGGGLNTFSTGAITDTDTGAVGTGGVIITSGSSNNLAATVASASVAGDVDVSNSDGDDATVNATFTGALTVGDDFNITNAEGDTADDVDVSVGGALSVGGITTVTAGGFAGANATLALSDDATFTGGLVMDDDTGTVTVTFDGTAAQNVTGTIDGNGANEGNIIVDNSTGVVFADDIGMTTNSIDTFTLTAGSVAEIQGDFTGADIVLGAGASFESSGGGTVDADITGSTGAETITLSGGETLGQAGNAIDLGAGNDTIEVSGGSAIIDADTLAGGLGTDTMTIGEDLDVSSDVTGFEAFDVADGFIFTVTGDVTGGTVTLGDGSSFEVNGGTVTSAVASDATGADAQSFTLTSGTMSGNVSLGAGIDDVTLTAGTMSGNLNTGAGADTIALDGSAVAGNIDGGADTDTATLGGNFTTSGTISNVELIDVNGNTLTVESAISGGGATYSTAGIDVNGGTLELNAGGSFDGSIFDTAGGGLLDIGADGNGGTFIFSTEADDVDVTVTSGTAANDEVAWGANGSLGAFNILTGARFNAQEDVTSNGALTNDGTLFIGAGYTFATATQVDGGGTFIFGIDDNAGESGFLNITGGAFDMTTSTIQAGVGIGNILDGDEILIVDGTGAIVGGPGGTAASVSDNSFLWDFEIVDGTGIAAPTNNTELYLVVTQANTISEAATTPGNAAAGDVLLSLNTAGDPQIDAILSSMNASTSAEDLNEVLEAVQPAVDGGAFVGSVNVMTNTAGIIGQELASLRSGNETGMAAGNISQGVRMWAQGFGQSADQDRRDNIDGYDADTYGAAVGIDSENLTGAVVGVALSYGNTQVESRNANRSETDVDSYQITLYGDYDVDRDTYLNGMFAYARSSADTTRHDVGGVSGLTATGNYDSSQYTIRAEAGRDYSYRGTTITPHVMGHWTHFNPDGYTETGAGGANLTVDMESMDIAELGIGADASWDLRQSNGAMLRPSMGIGYRYDLVGDAVQATSSFAAGGAAFASQGPDPAQSAVDLGASLDYLTTDNWQLTVNYNFEYREDFEAHSGFARAAYKF